MSEVTKYGILIVDDEPSNIMALSHILNPDYIIYAAKSGEGAIKAAEKHQPYLILLDIIMPDMDGYATIAELKKHPRTKHIPVIFVTGLGNVGDEEKGLTLGATDYITKPFSSAIVKLRVLNQIKMQEQLHTIERLSMQDQLTELPNRRCFNQRLNEEWYRSLREDVPLSILMIDLDKFKVYNDTHGHQQGDNALKKVAETFRATLKRSADYIARWGGEEFIALLPNTDAVGAKEVAEQIRQAIEQAEIPHADGKISKMTISIGGYTREIDNDETMDKFISKADEALYKAKATGRNMVCMM